MPDHNRCRVVSFDPGKQHLTLQMRGLDMARSAEIFAGSTLTVEDTRLDYDEPRWITVGYLDQRMVVLVWTYRDETTRIISLRKANDREQRNFGSRLG
jgi:uncharacterized protein